MEIKASTRVLRKNLASLRGPILFAAYFSVIINISMLSPTNSMLEVFAWALNSRCESTLFRLTLILLLTLAVMGMLESVRPRVLLRISSAFDRKLNGSVVEEISYHLVTLYRERADQEASLAASVIDRQSVTTTECGDAHESGAGKKINLIKRRDRHAMMDADGRGLTLNTHLVSINYRDGALPLLRMSRSSCFFVHLAFMGRERAGKRVADAIPIRVEIIRKPRGHTRFAIHARRWLVERFIAWISRNRRLARDFKAAVASANPFLSAAFNIVLIRRIACSA